ncbi:MAG: hypothetical protein IJQ81_01710 [Oscillibacter sp.]|nr:hypothetical protein [Oscillibacter sp.]
MKRVFKKLIAIALTGAMSLSLGVSAMAASLNGNVNSEGGLPPDVVSFTAPAPESGSFDLIVDPHDLIRTSAAAEKAKTAYSGKSFAEGAYAFFQKNEDGDITYGKESTAMKVTNKSSIPVTVKLDAHIDRTVQGTEKLTLVDTEAELATLTKKAGLYLAVKSGDTQTPISQNAFGDITVTIPANLQSYIIGSKFEWVDGVSNALKKALNTALTTTGKDFAVTLTPGTAAQGQTAAVDGKIGIADATWTNTTGSSDAATKLADTVTNNTRILTLSVMDGSKAVNVAKVTFYFDMAAVKAFTGTAPTGNVTIAGWNGDPFAKVVTNIENHATAYSIQEAPANHTAALVSSGGYARILDTSIEDFPEQEFSLVAAINRDDAWDSVNTSLSAAIKTVWTVTGYYAPADPIVTVTTPAVKNAEVAHVTYTVGKGEVLAKDVLAITYEADGKTTTMEAGAGSLTVERATQAGDPDPRAFDLTVATKMLAEGVPETAKVVFLMNDGSTKAVSFNFTQEG